MSTYVIVGASRGIGYAFITHLAIVNPANVVFGLVRDVEATTAKLKEDNHSSLSNLHIIKADITRFPSLKSAISEILEITSSIDILIINAAYNSTPTNTLPPSAYDDEAKCELLKQEMDLSILTNVTGVSYTINAFLPLIRPGKAKKIVALSSPSGDIGAILKTREYVSTTGLVPYSVSKAALNCLIAKYAIELRGEGIICFGISPGYVATDATARASPESTKKAFEIWKKIWPLFDGKAATPEESVVRMMNCIENLVTLEQTGEHLSFRGDKEFL